MTPSLQGSLPSSSSHAGARIEFVASVTFRRLAFFLLCFLLFIAIGGLSRCSLHAVSGGGAALLLVLLYPQLNPAGWQLELRPTGLWRCHERRSGRHHDVTIVVKGRLAGVLWLELYGPASREKKPLSPRRRPMSGVVKQPWLVFADALPEGDWRRLRRALRLQAHASDADRL